MKSKRELDKSVHPGIEKQQQRIREKKAWLHNSLLSAVGFCVVIYLQSLELASQS